MIFRLKILIYIGFFTVACKNEKKQLINEINDKSLVAETNSIPIVTEKDVVDQGIKSHNIEINNIEQFLVFYSENYDYIYKRNFVNYDEQYYRINFENVAYFLSELNKHSYLDEKFIKQLRNKFDEIDKTLETTKQSDGVPEGLEYDFILETQEIDEILEYLKNKKFSISSNEDSYLVNVNDVYTLSISLENEKILNIGPITRI